MATVDDGAFDVDSAEEGDVDKAMLGDYEWAWAQDGRTWVQTLADSACSGISRIGGGSEGRRIYPPW
ncbi:hypothetical protein A1O3_10433 [Capronia epimyces CBS 606.96]|uniref:Uncharacterized protein n=1 Tax=Capronia epimyces CBS 606.96 TaxID=1182542 RepID=W9XIT9_9EURO|nr:uncharacterized protein A1O3_10433 [Capronia epimyces CBS 606.96]EXJ77275.1 hypothetical protein A1O3_10433 [Capronia epimyces CBS 606.96]